MQIKFTFRSLIEQVRSAGKFLLPYFYLPAFVIFLAVVAFTLIKPSVKPEDLFRDITSLAEIPFYTGFVSQLGALLWSAGATCCFFALFLVRKLNAGSPQSRQFLFQAGLFTAFLMFDDIFLFHEEVASDLFSIGQRTVYLAYALIAIAFLFFNRNEILSSEYLFLGIALALFGMSIAMDVITDNLLAKFDVPGTFFETYEVFFEDGLKFLGIITWLAYYLRYINLVLTPVFKRVSIDQQI